MDDLLDAYNIQRSTPQSNSQPSTATSLPFAESRFPRRSHFASRPDRNPSRRVLTAESGRISWFRRRESSLSNVDMNPEAAEFQPPGLVRSKRKASSPEDRPHRKVLQSSLRAVDQFHADTPLIVSQMDVERATTL